MLFGGDVGFGETWHNRYGEKGKGNVLIEKGYEHMLLGLAPLMERADYTIVNMETPLVHHVDTSTLGNLKNKKYSNWGDPEKSPEMWKKYGFDAVSLANNHAFDFAMQGLPQTLEALDKYGIKYFGGGKDLFEASKPHIFKAGDLQVVVVGCYWEVETMRDKYNYYATEGKPGVFGIRESNAKQIFKKYRKEYPDAYLIAFPHFGKNYRWRNDRQVQLAHAMIDGGADIVIGHGAHKMQEVEYYKKSWILYNLGNFIYGAPGRYEKENSFRFSLSAELQFDLKKQEIKRVRIYPFYCDNKTSDYQSRPATEDEMKKVLQKLVKSDSNQQKLQRRMKQDSNKGGIYFDLELD